MGAQPQRQVPGSRQAERRNGRRVDRCCPMRYRTKGFRFHQGKVVNLSPSGARVMACTPLHIGSKVYVTIEIEPGWSIATAAWVAWCREQADLGSWIAGLAFAQLWQDDIDRLVLWTVAAEAQPPAESSPATSGQGARLSGPPVMPDLGWL